MVYLLSGKHRVIPIKSRLEFRGKIYTLIPRETFKTHKGAEKYFQKFAFMPKKANHLIKKSLLGRYLIYSRPKER
jgi:hypothetical protein